MRRYYLIPIIVIIAMLSLFATRNEPKYTPPVKVERVGVDWKTAVVKSENLKARKEQSEITKTMDTAIWTLILSTVAIILSNWLNPKLIKIERQVQDNHAENKAQHEEIRQELKIIKTPDKLESSLRQMTAGKLESCRPGLREFLNAESERLIDVANEIMRGSFDFHSLSQSLIKIDLAVAQSITDSCRYGDGFCHIYRDHIYTVAGKLKDDISDIVLDEIYNSKHSRFSLSCQLFLRDHLLGIIDIYEKIHPEQQALIG
jgi:hypothetical protein